MTAPGEFARVEAGTFCDNLIMNGTHSWRRNRPTNGSSGLHELAREINAAVAAHVQKAVKEAITCRVCGNKDSVCSSNWTREVRRAVEEFRESFRVRLGEVDKRHTVKFLQENFDKCFPTTALPLDSAEGETEGTR